MFYSNLPDIAQIIKALDILKTLNRKNEVRILNENERIVIQFSLKFVPLKGEKIIHIILPNIEYDTNEICLFVKDNDKGNRDYETSVQEYKDLLTKTNINIKIDIIPMKKLKLEFNDFEAKRQLSNLYDIFLADARIFRLLPEILGKNFISRKRFLSKVNFRVKDLKKEIEKSIKTVHICLSGHGPISQCTIGHFDMCNSKLAENIDAVIKKFSLHIDHGFANIRSINIKTNSSAAVPLYISLDEIEINDAKKELTPELVLEDEVSTVLEGKVRITKDGRIVIISNNTEIDVIANDCKLPNLLKHGRGSRKRRAVVSTDNA